MTYACVGTVTSPSGSQYHPELIDRHDGTVLVRCVPRQKGQHQLDVAYNDQPVAGSPWQFTAEPLQHNGHPLGDTAGTAGGTGGGPLMSAFGAGLSHGVATAPCQFTVQAHNHAPGNSHLSLCLFSSISLCHSLCLSLPVCLLFSVADASHFHNCSVA